MVRLIVLVMVLSGGACAQGDEGITTRGDANPASVVRDSAGIRIVENRRPSDPASTTWRIAAEPILEIGSESSGGVLFGNIFYATLKLDGEIAVVDGQVYEVTVFDSTGALLRTIGRRGEGPGEFRSAPLVRWSDDGELVAWDPASKRVSWFDDEGSLIRERSLAAALGDIRTVAGMWMVAGDGTLLGADYSFERDGDERRTTAEYVFVPTTADSTVDMGGYALPTSIRRPGWGWAVSSLFAHQPIMRLGPEGQRIYLADSDEWQVKRLDPRGGARVVEIIRVATPRIPVTQAMIEQHREIWRERAGSRPPSTYVDALREFEIPDSLPATQVVQFDAGGHLWIGRRSTVTRASPRDYLVLDGSGRWIANVIVPDEVSFLLDIGRDAVLTRVFGPLEEPLLRVHPIHR